MNVVESAPWNFKVSFRVPQSSFGVCFSPVVFPSQNRLFIYNEIKCFNYLFFKKKNQKKKNQKKKKKKNTKKKTKKKKKQKTNKKKKNKKKKKTKKKKPKQKTPTPCQ
jgi:hypothetical protein